MAMAPLLGTQFTCFTGTKVLILRQKALPVLHHAEATRQKAALGALRSLLALLVQKY
jgi:hypothetical protein